MQNETVFLATSDLTQVQLSKALSADTYLQTPQNPKSVELMAMLTSVRAAVLCATFIQSGAYVAGHHSRQAGRSGGLVRRLSGRRSP